MPIACVLVTHLPMKAELLRQPALAEKAVLIYQQLGERRVVVDRSALAGEAAAGMPLEQALARCSQATVLEADEAAYREIWRRMLDALESRSPLVEDADLGVAYVDLRGLERLYGDEPRLVKALAGSIAHTYRPRTGVAEGKFPAYVAALHAEPSGAFRAPGNAAQFLAPLSLQRLPASWEVKARLEGFGLKTLGSIAGLPVAAMQGEFGWEGAKLWRLANGQDESRLRPRPHAERITVGTAFAAPTAVLPAILVALEGLAASAAGSLRGRYARVAVLEGEVPRRPLWSKRLPFKEPVGDAGQAMRIFRDRLTDLALPGPLESLTLSLADITGEPGRQESLFRDVHRQHELDEAIRQLRSRLGGRTEIYRVREVEPWSRLPERRSALVAYEP